MIKAFIGIPVRGHAQDDFMREFLPAYARSSLKVSQPGVQICMLIAARC
jgi:hypothetical protein